MQTALSPHLNVRMQLPSDTVKRQRAEDLSQDIQPSGFVGILLRFLLPSNLEFTQILVRSVIHSCVITVSLPEADMIPRLPKHFHKLKLTSWENDYKLATV